jgi:hypothetical protein
MEVIKANRFVLVDEGGNDRAELSLVGGRPALKLFGLPHPGQNDESPDPDAIFQPRPNLALCDENGNALATLCIDKNYLALLLLDEHGKCRASLGVSASQPPWLTFFDQNGNPIWSAP